MGKLLRICAAAVLLFAGVLAPAAAQMTIPQLPAAGTLNGSELLWCVQSGADAKCTTSQVALALGYPILLGGHADGINCNSANTDTAIAITSPTANYHLNAVLVTMMTGAGGTATIGLFSATGGGGSPVMATSATTPSAVGVNVASTSLNLTVASSYFNFGTVYARVGTAQGATCTLNIYVFIRPLP